MDADRIQEIMLERCEELMEHVKLLRDYATTPDNVWLARGELNTISEQIGEIDSLLARLKEA